MNEHGLNGLVGVALFVSAAACSTLADPDARGDRAADVSHREPSHASAPTQPTTPASTPMHASSAEEETSAAEAPAPAPAQPAARSVRSTPCEMMTRTACMASRACELELAPRADGERSGQYVCRAAAGPCEKDIAQSELNDGSTPEEAEASRRACTDRPGCVLRQSDCYCDCQGYGRTKLEDGPEADTCDCYCAGGAPVACVSAGSTGS